MLTRDLGLESRHNTGHKRCTAMARDLASGWAPGPRGSSSGFHSSGVHSSSSFPGSRKCSWSMRLRRSRSSGDPGGIEARAASTASTELASGWSLSNANQ